MRNVLFSAILAIAAAGLGCSESTGGGSDPKPVGDSQLKPLPAPGSPGDAPAPKPGKPGAGGGAPGGTPISQ